MKQKTTKPSTRPRNYLARHPLMKKGGVHQKSEKAQRKAAKQSLKNEYGDEFPGESDSYLRAAFAREFQAHSVRALKI